MARKDKATTMAIAEAPVAQAEESVNGATTEGAPAQAGEAPAEAKAKRTLNGIYVNTPPVLREVIEANAKTEKKSVAGYVRDLLAQHFNVTLPAVTSSPRVKYATPEEKKAALVSRRKAHADEVREALAMLRELRAKQAQAGASAEAA